MHSQSELSDKALVKAYQNGQSEAFNVLLNRHRTKVYSYIMMMVKDHNCSEDIFQDCFIRVIQTLQSGKYTDEGKFLPWVMRIAHNLIIDHFRKNKRMPRFETEDAEFNVFDLLKMPEKNAEDQLIQQQTHDALHRLIEQLPTEQKEVVYMRHYAEMSFNEIAEQTQVSINTALGRMRYALINLRKLMEKHQMELASWFFKLLYTKVPVPALCLWLEQKPAFSFNRWIKQAYDKPFLFKLRIL